MSQLVLIVHAEGEDERVEELAAPIRDAGYEVWHGGMVLVGESKIEEQSKALNTGAPVVLCATERAIGRGEAYRFIYAARARNSRVSIFPVRMDEGIYVEALSLGTEIAEYWQDKEKALSELLVALRKHYPQKASAGYAPLAPHLENKYQRLALASFDIIDLDNLPDVDRGLLGKRIDLRRLYVTLRVQEESGPSPEKEAHEILTAEMSAVEDSPIEAEAVLTSEISTVESGHIRNKEKHKQKAIPLGRELHNERQLVVLGEAGSGKTTMLRWIASACILRSLKESGSEDFPDMDTLPKDEWLPIIIRCRELDPLNVSAPLEQLIRNTLFRLQIPSDEVESLLGIVKDRLERGKVLLLIDGLDEITDTANRESFCKQIESINAAYQEVPIIVTSRAAGYREMGCRIGRGFKHLVVSDLTAEDKDYFAHQWYAITTSLGESADATKELIEEIHSTDRIERLTNNPMLLTTMALVKRRGGKLPNNRVDLYGAAFDVLLNWRSRVDKPLDRREAGPQLEYLAFIMCDRGVQQLREDEIIEIFESLREDYPSLYSVQVHTPDEFLRLLEQRTGILMQAGSVSFRGRLVKKYEFRHLTFQEYLAALALVDGYYPKRRSKNYLTEVIAPLARRTVKKLNHESETEESVVTENWREALRMCVTISDYEVVDGLFRAILNPLEGEDPTITSRPRAVLAVSCLSEDPNGVSEEVVSEVLSAFVTAINDNDGLSFDADASGVQQSLMTSLDIAIQELSHSRWAEEVSKHLVAEFRNREPKVRWGIGCLIGAVMTPTLRGHEAVANWCERQASKICSKNEDDAITAALAIRVALAKKYLNPTANLTRGLLDMLTWSAPSAHAAASALAELNDESNKINSWMPLASEVAVLSSFVGDPSSDLGAVRFISSILGREGDERSVKPLIGRLGVNDIAVRVSAVEALGNIKDARAIEPLITLLSESDSSLKGAVIDSLKSFKDARVLEALVPQLDDQDVTVRREIIDALRHFSGATVERVIVASLDDSNPAIRAAALGSLTKVNSEELVDRVLNSLGDESSEVRKAALMQIPKIAGARAVELLISKASDRDIDVAFTAIIGLGFTSSQPAFEFLVSKLNDENEYIQYAAAYALARPADPNITKLFVKPLLHEFNKNDEELLSEIAEALKKIECDEKVEPLLNMLSHKRREVRSSAILALSNCKRQDVLEAVINKLEDESEKVRKEAAAALGELGDLRALQPLLQRLEDNAGMVIIEAAFALGKLKDKRATVPLLAKLNDKRPNVCVIVIQALSELKDERALKPLLPLLENPNAYIRRLTVRALGSLETQAIVTPLLKKLEDEARDVRVDIVDVLAGLEGDNVEFAVVSRLKDTNATVRVAAGQALVRRAVSRFDAGSLSEAIAIFETILESIPTDDQVRNNLVFCYMLNGQYEPAVKQVDLLNFSDALMDRPLWQLNRGLLSYLIGEIETGVAQLRTALDWVEAAGPQYNPREVYSVLLLNPTRTISSVQDVPIDVAIILNLYLVGGNTLDETTSELSKRYPSEYNEWLGILSRFKEPNSGTLI